MSDILNNDSLTALLKSVVKEAVREVINETSLPRHGDDTARKLAVISAKPYLTVPEAELLLGCSNSHLYRKIKDAKRGKTNDPIPFRDIGVYIFPREELLAWVEANSSRASKAA